MQEEILSKIIKLIEGKMGKYKKPITRETCLEKDLGITGDDAVELLLEYSKKFSVDVSNFMAADYFEGEGIQMDIINPIIRLITGKKKKEVIKKELTVGDLEKGVGVGRLDEEVING